jgi:hypothetical protein
MVPSSPGIGQVKYLCKIHIQPGLAHNAQGLVIMGLPQVQVVDAGQGLPCMQMKVTGARSRSFARLA